MKYLAILFCVMTLYSCSNNKGNKGQINKDSLVKNSIIEKKSSIDNNMEFLLKGVWAEKEEDNALFSLDGEHINYTEGTKPYTYTVNGDTVILNLQPIAKLLIIKISKDSLWFTDNFNDDTTKLYRR